MTCIVGLTEGEIDPKDRSDRSSQSIEPYEVRSGATNFPCLEDKVVTLVKK